VSGIIGDHVGIVIIVIGDINNVLPLGDVGMDKLRVLNAGGVSRINGNENFIGETRDISATVDCTDGGATGDARSSAST
jgi:hypothetical protein